MRVTRRKARHAQYAERIFRKRRGDVTQQSITQIVLTAIRVNDLAVFVLRQRVDGEIATQEILLQRDVRCGIAGEAGITRTGFPFGTRQGVLLTALRMQKHGKIAAYLLVARVKHLFRCGSHHHPVFIFDRQT